jgi:hypothetical protein
MTAAKTMRHTNSVDDLSLARGMKMSVCPLPEHNNPAAHRESIAIIFRALRILNVLAHAAVLKTVIGNAQQTRGDATPSPRE